ncbi:DUF4920 domain-containing protein [Psychroserpens burtonensis]|uniref:DUF4920 domain-containing protein n=1 Tax=Psychroserpens burtonensis TaxID=49278 RepID=A0A5C7B8C7_9FLAO|nr:DUF4920 domain-containing protein [Psychroserpens burtonensis]TXE18536.1 DUF4920 domain-containing protein [Psychroserpens burtonensis]
MKHILIIALAVVVLVSCKEDKNVSNEVATLETETVTQFQDIAYESFGKKITSSDAITAKRMAVHYASMTVGDSIDAKMVAKVEEVCQSKGCWMKLDLPDGEQVMVKFKDYGFFMPKDISGKEVVINGKAYINEVPVDEQRHYAEDGGATPQEIAKITEAKKTYSFLADGVLLNVK